MSRNRFACVIAMSMALLWTTGADAVNVISETHMGLLHTLQTDEYLYELGDLVHVAYTVENTTDAPIELAHPQCGCPVWVTIFAPPDSVVWCNPCGCFDEYCTDTLDPGESYVKDFIWDMENYWTGELIETTGIHLITGRLKVHPFEYQFEVALDIEILEELAAVPGSEAVLERTWCTIKALYR